MVSEQRWKPIHPGFPDRDIFEVVAATASSLSKVLSNVIFNAILEKARLMVEWLKWEIPNFLPVTFAAFLIDTPLR